MQAAAREIDAFGYDPRTEDPIIPNAAILRGVARSSREARRSSSPSRRARRRARHRNRQRYACTDATGLQYGVRAKNAVGAQLACEDAGYTQCVCTPY